MGFEFLKGFIQIVNVLSALAVIILVLLQHGKGADMGAAFGSGSAGSLFGASGSANFLSRTTAVCATIFFCTLFGLVWFDAGLGGKKDGGVMSTVVQQAPAAPAPGAAPAPVAPAGTPAAPAGKPASPAN